MGGAGIRENIPNCEYPKEHKDLLEVRVFFQYIIERLINQISNPSRVAGSRSRSVGQKDWAEIRLFNVFTCTSQTCLHCNRARSHPRLSSESLWGVVIM